MMTEMNLEACIDQITSIYAYSYCGKNRDTSLIIQMQRPTYKMSGNTLMDKKGKSFTITSARIQTRLRAAVQIPGKGQLGFRPMEMGAHSICSGAAMAIYLTGV